MGEVELDPGTRTVLQKGKPVELTSVEFNLLHVLLREAGRVVPRERLVDIVLSRKFSPFDRSIDMHVSKIRKKLGDSDSGVDHIKTVRGVGYIFTRPQEPLPRRLRQGRARSLLRTRAGAACHEKSVSQDFSFVLGGAGSVPGPRHPDHGGGARARRDRPSGMRNKPTCSARRSRLIEQGGPAEVRRYLDEVRESQHVRAYLLDEQGKDVSGRDLPHWAESLAKGVTPPRRDFWQSVTPSPFRRQVHGRGQRTPLHPGGVSCRPTDPLDRAAFPA